ncbi:MAG TPA: L-threonylcarbamoyladenylate synthase [Acidobacteriaceae bacterium]|nr:L-threonylcarbamoyladenylate synthase [Acidobacteriaceae bacterium]
MTLRLKVEPREQSAAAIAEAAAILRGGGTVAIPTETVYGLGANAFDAAAVAKIFAAKERPAWDPLIVHVADEAMLREVVAEVSPITRRLMDAYWPGPLTLLLPRTAAIPDAVTAGRPLVGVRMPAHPVARAVIYAAGVPVAAPSANRFGHTSPTTAEHVLEDLDGRIDAVVDGGPAEFGLESTVLDPNAMPVTIYRPGAVTLEQIRMLAGDAVYFREPAALVEELREALPSPGVGLRHYAPRAKLVLFGTDEGAPVIEGASVGLMRAEGLPGAGAGGGYAAVYPWGRWAHPNELAQRLFAGLRYLDGMGCEVILCPVPEGGGIAEAIRDRLRKASWR